MTKYLNTKHITFLHNENNFSYIFFIFFYEYITQGPFRINFRFFFSFNNKLTTATNALRIFFDAQLHYYKISSFTQRDMLHFQIEDERIRNSKFSLFQSLYSRHIRMQILNILHCITLHLTRDA